MHVYPRSRLILSNFWLELSRRRWVNRSFLIIRRGARGPGVALIALPRSTATLGPATQLLIADRQCSILSRVGTTSCRSFRHHRIPEPISSPNQGRSLSVVRRQVRTARPLFRRLLRPRGRPERSSRRLQLRGRPEHSYRRLQFRGGPERSYHQQTVSLLVFGRSSSVLCCRPGLRENKVGYNRG